MVTTSQVDMTPLDAPVCKAVGRKASLLLGLGSDRSRLVIATTGENNVVIRIIVRANEVHVGGLNGIDVDRWSWS